MNIYDKTKLLLQHIARLKEFFELGEPPKDVRDKAFFLQVKEETEPIYKLLEEWEEETLHAIKNREISLHPQQIISTKENLELLIMHSYYKDLRRRRYNEYYKSIQYILEQIIYEHQ